MTNGVCHKVCFSSFPRETVGELPASRECVTSLSLTEKRGERTKTIYLLFNVLSFSYIRLDN